VIFENSKKILERTENIFEAAEQRRPKIRTQGTQDSTREMTARRDPKLRRIESMAALVSIALLVLAANLRDPSFWLVAPAWLVLALIAYLRFDEVPSDSPYKSAFYLMGIPLLFYVGLWRTALHRFADVLSQPSWRHIYALVSSRSFLVLVILYLAAVCVFYSGRLRKREESSETYKRTVSE
jgi:hypothetical protein